jgi:membrane-bound lytic murein transglycosylase D
MINKKLKILIMILLLMPGFSGKAYTWSFFKIIDSGNSNDAERKELENFNIEDDILYLPPLKDKAFFESIADLSICRKKDVRYHIYEYLTFGREYLTNAIMRSGRYISIVEEIIKNDKDIPPDIALLPLLESGFNPYALSRSKAAGLWQFLNSTGKSLGLRNDSWIDERRDIEKSTLAAIRHLKSLYNTFNSWELALTAYNGGAGYVRAVIRKGRTTDLRELQRRGLLKKETSEFVPRFASLAVLYRNRQLFGIDGGMPAEPAISTEEFVLEFPVDIRNIEKYTGVPMEIIRKYNPELKKNITPPYFKNYTIRIPSEAKESFLNNKQNLSGIYYRKLERHIVKQGECISVIAARYNAEIKKILNINNIDNPKRIRPGLELFIPI